MTAEELWKDVPGYEGLYLVSNLGRVKRLKHAVTVKSHNSANNKRTLNEMLMKLHKSRYGYITIIIGKSGYRVHRLVAMAFIDKPLCKEHVNHINGIKTDNRVTNLEWVTCKENIQHAFRTGLSKISSKNIEGTRKRSSKPVLDTSTGIEYKSLVEVSKVFGLKYQALKNNFIKTRRNNTTFIWKQN